MRVPSHPTNKRLSVGQPRRGFCFVSCGNFMEVTSEARPGSGLKWRGRPRAACRSACLAETGLRIRLGAFEHVAVFVRHAHELLADLGVGALLGKTQKSFCLFSEEFGAFHGLLCLARITPLAAVHWSDFRPILGGSPDSWTKLCKTAEKGPAAKPAGPQCRKPGAGEGGLRAPGTKSIPRTIPGSEAVEFFSRPRKEDGQRAGNDVAGADAKARGVLHSARPPC